MKKIGALLIGALCAMSMVVLAGCGTSQDASTTSTTAVKQSINVCLASEPATIDPALNSSVDGATLIIHAFSGIAGYQKQADGSLKVVADCATEIPEGVVGDDGKVTYTFTLRDGLKWSDGSALTAGDFVYAWNRAVNPNTAADYAYMFEVVDGYADASQGTGQLNVTAPDDKTLVVVLSAECPYFDQLLAFPAYMPVKQSAVEASPDAWATDPSTYICNGPYVLKEWTHNSVMTYEKNPNYIDADKVTMDEINFYLSDDNNNMLSNFKNGDWQFIDDVPVAEISNLKTSDPDEFFVEGQLGTYYACWNINQDLLPTDSKLEGVDRANANAEVRNALSLLLDRNYVVESIAQGGQVPASSFVAMGLTDADGTTQFYENAGDPSTNGYPGYFNTSKDAFESNVQTALDTLKKYYTFDDASGKFTNFPPVDYLYNTSDNHKAIAEYIQSAFDAYGITITITNQEWDSFLETRKNGEFTMARNGWLADYNDPISFLDLWTTQSGNNDCQFGKGDNADLKAYSLTLTKDADGVDYTATDDTWANTYDYLIAQIKSCTDTNQRFSMMHKAEDLLMSTGCICPIYYYTDLYMCSSNLTGVYSSPLGFKYFMYSTLS